MAVLEETLNFIFHFVFGGNSLSSQMFIQISEQVVLTWCQVRTIRWVSDDVPFKLLQKSNGLTGDVWARIIVGNAYILAQLYSVLHCLFEFFQCCTVPARVLHGPRRHKIDSLSIQVAMALPADNFFELLRLERIEMPPLL